MAKGIWGVLIADVVRSRSTPGLRSLLSSKLRTATRTHLAQKRIRLPYAVTAGDEFQTIAAELSAVPGLVFDLRRQLRPIQLRIGIGIGPIPGRLRPPVNQLGGPAFQMARQAIEETKSGRAHRFEAYTAFRSANRDFDRIANLVYGLHDALVWNLTEKQWQAIDAYVSRRRVDLAARALRVSVSTASRSLKRGHFWHIEETIDSMAKIILRAFPHLHESVQNSLIA